MTQILGQPCGFQVPQRAEDFTIPPRDHPRAERSLPAYTPSRLARDGPMAFVGTGGHEHSGMHADTLWAAPIAAKAMPPHHSAEGAARLDSMDGTARLEMLKSFLAEVWTDEDGEARGVVLSTRDRPRGSGLELVIEQAGVDWASVGAPQPWPKVCHYMIQPLVELYGGCMVVLKVS